MQYTDVAIISFIILCFLLLISIYMYLMARNLKKAVDYLDVQQIAPAIVSQERS